jgi:hypothetical protein
VNAEFNWWLLIVGLVVGAALTWLVMAESARRDADVGDDERRSEAVWISSLLSSPDRPVEPRRVEEILRLHGEYLAGPPPDEPDELDESESFDGSRSPKPAPKMKRTLRTRDRGVRDVGGRAGVRGGAGV